MNGRIALTAAGIAAIRCAGRPCYQIGKLAGFDRSTFSSLMHGYRLLDVEDDRAERLAGLLNVPFRECWASVRLSPGVAVG